MLDEIKLNRDVPESMSTHGNAPPHHSAPTQVLGLSFDIDGCAIVANQSAINPRLIDRLEALIKKKYLALSAQDSLKVVIFLGSLRQSLGVDQHNHYTNQSGRYTDLAREFPSSVHILLEVAKQLKQRFPEHNNLEVVCSEHLMDDLEKNVQEGRYHRTQLKDLNVEWKKMEAVTGKLHLEDFDPKWRDYSKISLTFSQIQELAFTYPGVPVEYHFLDDHPGLLVMQRLWYQHFPWCIPMSVDFFWHRVVYLAGPDPVFLTAREAMLYETGPMLALESDRARRGNTIAFYPVFQQVMSRYITHRFVSSNGMEGMGFLVPRDYRLYQKLSDIGAQFSQTDSPALLRFHYVMMVNIVLSHLESSGKQSDKSRRLRDHLGEVLSASSVTNDVICGWVRAFELICWERRLFSWLRISETDSIQLISIWLEKFKDHLGLSELSRSRSSTEISGVSSSAAELKPVESRSAERVSQRSNSTAAGGPAWTFVVRSVSGDGVRSGASAPPLRLVASGSPVASTPIPIAGRSPIASTLIPIAGRSPIASTPIPIARRSSITMADVACGGSVGSFRNAEPIAELAVVPEGLV